jgi:SpoIID/LytB domain protein
MTRRLLPLVLLAAVAATLVPALPAAAGPSTFTFRGSGWGHGIGMSQWGANGLARMGWGHTRILTHFYRGTKVQRLDSLPRSVRVQITSGRSRIRLTAKAGPVRLWVGEPLTGRLIAKIPMDKTWSVNVKGTGYAIRNGAGALIGDRTWGGPNRHVYATYADTASRVFVPEADETRGRGFTYNRGHLEFNLTGCGSGCRLRAIVPLGVEEYLYGLGEVPASWPVETLRAQAVAARSYLVATMRGGLRASCNCHITDGANDQVYIAFDREGASGGGRWVSAVDTTTRKVVTHNGGVIQAFYAASDGGHSENVEDVWHGGNKAYSLPWLSGVCDPGESIDGNPWLHWTKSYGATELTSRLAPHTGAIGTVTGFGRIVRGTSGRIVTAVVRGTNGSRQVRGSSLRSALGLYDTRVWINADRTIRPGPIREKYDALMCRPGLATSAQRALPGGRQQLFHTGGIFRNDGAALTLWLKGPVFAEYRANGTGGGRLGLPASKLANLAGGTASRAIDCSACSRVNFERGRIYWKQGVGAHALWGRVLTTYLKRGGAGGELGFPTTRVRTMDGGGTRARFEHGAIACPKGQSCRVTRS